MIKSQSRGFTLVEIMVISPIIILAIGAFIAMIITMTGEVLSSRAANMLAYDVQDALNRIEQDVKLSGTFLAENNVPVSSSTGQGWGPSYNNKFTNVSSSRGDALILNSLVTNKNPLDPDSRALYLADSPSPCSSDSYIRNKPLMMNIVYFVEDGALWRRTIMPSNYNTESQLCGGTSWYQPSCKPGKTSSFCKTEDIRVINGISGEDFSVSYFLKVSDNDPNLVAESVSSSVSERNGVLGGLQTAEIKITAKSRVSGRDISRSGSLRATRLDTNAVTVAP